MWYCSVSSILGKPVNDETIRRNDDNMSKDLAVSFTVYLKYCGEHTMACTVTLLSIFFNDSHLKGGTVVAKFADDASLEHYQYSRNIVQE